MTQMLPTRLLRAALITTALSAVFAAPAFAADVTVNDKAYSPSAVTINTGESVTWNFRESGHNVKGDGGINGNNSFGTGTYSKTFTTAGTFSYICEAHPDMKGSVTVNAAPAPTPDPAQPQPGTTDPNAGQPAATNPTAGAAAATGLPVAREDRLAPALTSLRASMKRGARRPTLSLRLNEAATVVVGLRRVMSARTASAGLPVLRLTGKPGANRFSLKVRGLRRGTYRLRVVAIDAAGNESRLRTAKLRIAR